jgi:hypothetical protein
MGGREILMNAKEVKQIEEDLAYWQELADLLGWKVYGFTFKNTASYQTGKDLWNTIQLTGGQRDDIVKAIRNGR